MWAVVVGARWESRNGTRPCMDHDAVGLCEGGWAREAREGWCSRGEGAQAGMAGRRGCVAEPAGCCQRPRSSSTTTAVDTHTPTLLRLVHHAPSARHLAWPGRITHLHLLRHRTRVPSSPSWSLSRVLAVSRCSADAGHTWAESEAFSCPGSQPGTVSMSRVVLRFHARRARCSHNKHTTALGRIRGSRLPRPLSDVSHSGLALWRTLQLCRQTHL